MEIFTSTETMMMKGFAKYKWVQVLCVNNIIIIIINININGPPSPISL